MRALRRAVKSGHKLVTVTLFVRRRAFNVETDKGNDRIHAGLRKLGINHGQCVRVGEVTFRRVGPVALHCWTAATAFCERVTYMK